MDDHLKAGSRFFLEIVNVRVPANNMTKELLLSDYNMSEIPLSHGRNS